MGLKINPVLINNSLLSIFVSIKLSKFMSFHSIIIKNMGL